MRSFCSYMFSCASLFVVMYPIGTEAAADLTIEITGVSPSSVAAGSSVTINYRVSNIGTSTAGSNGAKFYLSSNTSLGSDTYLSPSTSVGSLCANCSATGSITRTIPSGTLSGTWYIIGLADAFDAIAESNENNNTGYRSFTVSGSGGSPDLIVQSPGVSDSSLTPGEEFIVSATVRNQGTASSNSTTLRYYRSTNSTISGNDIEIATGYVSSLSSGSTSPASSSVTAPSNQGTYWIGACVDAVAGEISTSNNCSDGVQISVSQTGSPDLIVENPSVSDATLTPGQSFTAGGTVRNQGNLNSDSTTLRYFQSTDLHITTSDSQIGTDSVSSLSPGSISPESDSVNAPSSTGTYWIGACVDSVFGESNASNNCSSGVQITVAAASAPDLTIEVTSLPNTATPGQSISIGYRVSNIGNLNAGSHAFKVYLSLDASLDGGDTYLTPSVSVGALPAGGSSSGNVSKTLPVVANGTWYIIGEADAFDAISESNEGNNLGSRSFTISTPNDPPTIQITAGPTGSTFDHDVTFEWAGQDTDGTVQGYEAELDGSAISTALTSITYYDLSEEQHTFRVRCRDDDDAWSEWDDRSFTVFPQSTTGGIETTILDQNDTPNPDAVCLLYDDTWSLMPEESTTADSNGVCSWVGLDPDNYYIEAYSPGPQPYPGNDFWAGTGVVSVEIGQMTNVPPLHREWPFAAQMRIRRDGPLGQLVTEHDVLDVGTALWIGVWVENRTPADQTAKVFVQIENGLGEAEELDAPLQLVSSGASMLFELNYTPTEPGVFRRALKVESFVNNTFVKTDSSGWYQAFEVDGGLHPVADFTWSPTEPAENVTVYFSDASSGGIDCWRWYFDSDGNIDSTARNPTHTFTTAGPHEVTLTVENAHGEDVKRHTVEVQSNSGNPYVIGVTREYPGFFLDGVDLSNTFDISVDWQGTLGSVEIEINGGAPQTVSSETDGVEFVFDMGQDFSPSWQANTIAITPINGAGTRGSTHTETVFVFPYPYWLARALSLGFGDLTITAGFGEVLMELDTEFPRPHLSSGCDLSCAASTSCEDCTKIPQWVPYIGGTLDLLETYTTVEGQISSNGLGNFDVYGQTGFYALGGGKTGGGIFGRIHGSGDFRLFAPAGLELTTGTFTFTLDGALGKEVGLIDAIPALSWVPPVVKNPVNAHAKLRGEIWPSLELMASFAQDSDGNIRFREGTGALGLGLKVTLEVDPVDNLSATGWVSGDGSATIGVPEPFMRELQVGMEVGAEFEVFLWSFGPYTYAAGCTWTPSIGTVCEEDTGEEKAARMADLPGGVPLRPTVANYGEFGEYDRFVAKPLERKTSSLVPADIAGTTVISNIASSARPKLVETTEGTLLLWEHQDQSLPLEQATDISWSIGDGASWTAPALINNDTRSEYGISAGIDAAGVVVAAWARIKDANFTSSVATTDDIPPFNKRFDVVSAVFDPGTHTWGLITSITDDDDFDRGIAVSGAGSGGLLLTWLSNPDGLYTSTETSHTSVKSSIWTGTTWGPVTTVASELVGVTRYASAYMGSQGLIILERDPTPEIPGDTVLDLYSLSDSVWSPRTIFSAGGVDNRMPSVAIDDDGEGHVVWVRDGDLVHATLSDPTPEILRLGSDSIAFFSARLLSEPGGHLTVLWQEVVDNGPADLFAMIFDSDNGRWSVDRRLTGDGWMGHGLDAFYGSDGILRVAYAATEILRTTRQVDFNSSSWTINNIPRKGRTDIRTLEHSLIVDLAVNNSDLSVFPLRPNVGDSVSVTVNVHNAGDFATGGFVVDYFLGEPESGGTMVGRQSIPGPFAAGSTAVQQFEFTQPAVGGNLVVVVDGLDQVTEFSETNNRATSFFENIAPIARIVATPTAGQPPLSVSLDATSSYDFENDTLGFQWTFADGGNAASGAIVSRTFPTTGYYPVSLAVSDGYGGADTAEVIVTVSPDSDGDGFLDLLDNCPPFANAGQEDSNADGIGDVCEAAGWIFSDGFEGGLPGVWSSVRGLVEPPEPPPTGISESDVIRWYDFSSGAGTMLVDSSNNGVDLTITDATWTSTETPQGRSYSLDFDGQGDYCKGPSTRDDVAGLSEFTVFGWFLTEGPTTMALCDRVDGEGDVLWFVSYDGSPISDSMKWDVTTDAGIASTRGGLYPMALDTWHFLAMTYDGQTMKIFVDGLLSQNFDTGMSSQIVSSAAETFLFIGRNNHLAYAQDWLGNIAQVGIVAAVLSPEEISDLYNSGNGLTYSGFFSGGNPCSSEFYDLNDNQLPAGWDLTTSSSAGFSGGKLWGHTVDGWVRMEKDVSSLTGITSFRFEYDGMLAASTWGITNGVNLWLPDDTRFTVINLKASNNYGTDNVVRIHTPATPGWQEAVTYRFPNEPGEFHYRLDVTQGQVRFVATRPGDGSVAFDITEPLPSLDVDAISSAGFTVGTTTVSDNWIDNLGFEVCSSP